MTDIPRLKSNNILFIFIDLQKKLLNQIGAAEKIVDGCGSLFEAAEILKIPSIVTSQYRKGLGELHEEFAKKISHEVIDKTAFSCVSDSGFREELQKYSSEWVAVMGIETHICVMQTALDLLSQGRKVAVVTDSVGARGEEDHNRGLERMQSSGALMVTREMLIYEMLERSDTPEFRKILPLIKGA